MMPPLQDRAAAALSAILGFDEPAARTELAELPDSELQALQGAATRLARVADLVRVERAMTRLRDAV